MVGAGDAAFCAVFVARESGASVLVLERAPKEECGGNTAVTAGVMRFAYDGVEQIEDLCPELTQSDLDSTDFGSYSNDQFYDDLCRVTEYRTDPDLAHTLVSKSFETRSG